MDNKTQKKDNQNRTVKHLKNLYTSSIITLKQNGICINHYLKNFQKNLNHENAIPVFKAQKSLKFAPVKAVLVLTLFCTVSAAFAQTTTTVNGPSDATSNPPASASSVNQVLAQGNNISLKIGNSSTSSDVIYQWYKLDNTGTKRLVQSSSSSTLTESPSTAGYYIYQLVVSNSNQCSSEISDPFKVYVLPPLTPTIAASSSTVCSNGTNTSVLTANPGSDRYSYVYQWILNGNNIQGATSSTYTTPTNLSSGNQNYSIRIAYSLSTATTGTANQVITVTPLPTKPAISIGQ
ncbi:MAG: hypothetical protein EOP42_06370 [Sphingobacteriaceae bacterium]|nr:MAG: hypothetical protein EOP42_06370 [Sphingobacteriaceae bacterium]